MLDLVSNVASNIVTNGISKLVLGNDKVATTAAAVADTSATTTTTTASSDFDALLKQFLPADSNTDVSEEELFSAAAGERINTLKGADGLKAYQEALATEKQALTKPDGFVPTEQVTVNALKKLVSDGVISSEEGDQIYTDSFAAAQLDDNKESLFDNRGGANDPTIAVAKMSEAMLKIKNYIDNIDPTRSAETLKSLGAAAQTGSSSTIPGSSALNSSGLSMGVSTIGAVTPNGTYVDGSEGFLFKPVTNNEGSLAVMFGQSWTNNIASVSLLDQAGNLIEAGQRKPYGISETGREKFTFSKQGGSYPKDISVAVTFNDGAVKTFAIPDPSKRYD